MKFSGLVLEDKKKEKLSNYSENLKIKEFFYSKKIKNEYLSVFYLINIQFWKSKTFPFFAFVFPVFFIGILGKMLGYENMFSNVISISSTSIGLIALPTSILEFKNSILLKRIGVTRVSQYHFIMIIFFFYFLIMLLGTLFTVILSILLFYEHWNGVQFKSISLGRERNTYDLNLPYFFKNGINITNRVFVLPFKNYFYNANWIGVLYGFFLNCILALVLGVVITSFSKSLMALQALAVPIMVVSNFLSGQVLPLNLIVSNPHLWNISYITPFKFTNSIIIESFNGNPGGSAPEIHLDLSSLSKILNDGNGFQEQLTKKIPGVTKKNFQTIIDSLKNGTYSNGGSGGGSSGATKYDWLNGNGEGNKLVKVDSIEVYIKDFLLNFWKATQKTARTWNVVSVFSDFVETLLGFLGAGKKTEEFPDIFKELDVTSPTITSYTIPSISPANPFNIFAEHKSFSINSRKILNIITSTEKVLNHSVIYLWILGLMLIGINKFKWSNR